MKGMGYSLKKGAKENSKSNLAKLSKNEAFNALYV
jgi:hypothetical protein